MLSKPEGSIEKGYAKRQMQKQCVFPNVDALKQKCRYSCHINCMLPRELIWEEVAPPHQKGTNTERPYTSEYGRALLINAIHVERCYINKIDIVL